MNRILFAVAISLMFNIAQAAENKGFKCMASLAQQSWQKDHYNIEGEQNPPAFHYDYTTDGKKSFYFKVLATGNYIHGLEITTDPIEAILRVDLERVEPNLPDIGNGVQFTLDTKYAYTRAGLGMRDSYNTYVQNVTAKLHNGSLGFILLTCMRN